MKKLFFFFFRETNSLAMKDKNNHNVDKYKRYDI